ncbi:MAG: hypothetical protein OEZ43_17805 [Gammaproteobacteria bacterium]|nr:hypothetical protein [Gammaproteobacteria bacterium]
MSCEKLDENELKEASSILARIIAANSHNTFSISVNELSEQIYVEAMGFCNTLISNNCDPNSVSSAMKYLSEKHTFSFDKDNGIHWPYMLEVLLEIVCPRVESGEYSKPFIKGFENILKSYR